jgi:hypothetical protein
MGRLREQLAHNPFSQLTRSLVLFLDDADLHSGTNVGAGLKLEVTSMISSPSSPRSR